MSLPNCAADKGALSPDNPTKWLRERATALFVTCQNTCYKWDTSLFAERQRDGESERSSGVNGDRLRQTFPSRHADAYLKPNERRRESGAAWQSGRRVKNLSGKLSGFLGSPGTALQKPLWGLTLPSHKNKPKKKKDVHRVSWDINLDRLEKKALEIVLRAGERAERQTVAQFALQKIDKERVRSAPAWMEHRSEDEWLFFQTMGRYQRLVAKGPRLL